MRGAAAEVETAAMAFTYRRDQWDSDIISRWTDAADDKKNISRAKKFWKETEHFSNGVYVNHIGSDDDPRIATAYGVNYERLKSIKKKYDPDNFFRINNNIRPA